MTRDEMKEVKFLNRDPRLGATCEFTLLEMVQQYRICSWDEYEDANGQTMQMTDGEIIEEILKCNIEQI